MINVTVGIDLTKNVFAVHGVDKHVMSLLVRPNVTLAKLLKLIAALSDRPRGLLGQARLERRSGRRYLRGRHSAQNALCTD